MKTREQFLTEVEIFQTRFRRIDRYLLVPTYVLIGLVAIATVMMFPHVATNSRWYLLPVALLLGGLMGIVFLEERRGTAMLKKCGLVCSSCGKTLRPQDIKVVTDTHDCPFCGQPFFTS